MLIGYRVRVCVVYTRILPLRKKSSFKLHCAVTHSVIMACSAELQTVLYERRQWLNVITWSDLHRTVQWYHGTFMHISIGHIAIVLLHVYYHSAEFSTPKSNLQVRRRPMRRTRLPLFIEPPVSGDKVHYCILDELLVSQVIIDSTYRCNLNFWSLTTCNSFTRPYIELLLWTL